MDPAVILVEQPVGFHAARYRKSRSYSAKNERPVFSFLFLIASAAGTAT